MPAAFLGIDVGTSAVKVLALAENGQVLVKAKRGYETRSPEIGWAEQSPENWWNATAAATREVMAQLGEHAVVGVGLSGQLNGFVLLDANGEPLQDAIIWLDRRAMAESDLLTGEHGSRILEVSGNRVSPISVMPKLLWMKRHRADVLARAARLLLVKDYILWRLADAHATDPSDASAINLMDIATRQWSADLCRAIDISPALLPKIIPSTAVAGRITREASAETGIPASIPVAPGGGDVAALALGCGVISEGVLGVTLGTAGHVVVSSRRPLPRADYGLWQIPHIVEDHLIWLGLIMAGGLSLSWIHRIAGHPTIPFDDFSALAGAAAPGSGGLIFLPFLEGAATPYQRPGARASFIGLTSSHGAAEMIRAVMEGVAFNLRQCVELFEEMGVRVTEVRLAEGGSRIGLWCQIIADVLGRPIVLIEESDTSALGAAIAAQACAMRTGLTDLTDHAVQASRRYQPTEGINYDASFKRYLEFAEFHARA